MNNDEIKSELTNLKEFGLTISNISRLMYPEKKLGTAVGNFRHKLNRTTQYWYFTEGERQRITEIIKAFKSIINKFSNKPILKSHGKQPFKNRPTKQPFANRKNRAARPYRPTGGTNS